MLSSASGRSNTIKDVQFSSGRGNAIENVDLSSGGSDAIQNVEFSSSCGNAIEDVEFSSRASNTVKQVHFTSSSGDTNAVEFQGRNVNRANRQQVRAGRVVGDAAIGVDGLSSCSAVVVSNEGDVVRGVRITGLTVLVRSATAEPA